MIYRSIVIDDEPLARKVILDHAGEIPDLVIVSECSSALQAHSILSAQEVHIIYLDIEMPKLSGIDFARQLNQDPLIIFTTAYSEYAVEAFEVDAFDYLVKPISFERFLASFVKAKRRLTEGERAESMITLKEGRRLYRVDRNEILYLQAYGDYVRVFTPGKTYLPLMTLQQAANRLDAAFQQVHRSYIVHLEKIDYIEGNYLMIGEKQIPISNTYRDDLMARF